MASFVYFIDFFVAFARMRTVMRDLYYNQAPQDGYWSDEDCKFKVSKINRHNERIVRFSSWHRSSTSSISLWPLPGWGPLGGTCTIRRRKMDTEITKSVKLTMSFLMINTCNESIVLAAIWHRSSTSSISLWPLPGWGRLGGTSTIKRRKMDTEMTKTVKLKFQR